MVIHSSRTKNILGKYKNKLTLVSSVFKRLLFGGFSEVFFLSFKLVVDMCGDAEL